MKKQHSSFKDLSLAYCCLNLRHQNGASYSFTCIANSPSSYSLAHKPATIKQLIRIIGGENSEFKKACLARLALHDFLKHECGEGELLPAEDHKFGDFPAIEAVTYLFQTKSGARTLSSTWISTLTSMAFLKQAAEKHDLSHTTDNQITFQKINK